MRPPTIVGWPKTDRRWGASVFNKNCCRTLRLFPQPVNSCPFTREGGLHQCDASFARLEGRGAAVSTWDGFGLVFSNLYFNFTIIPALQKRLELQVTVR